MNIPAVDSYTVHYNIMNGGSGRRRRQAESGTAIFPASASSGVVSGLQEEQQYQFSVSLSFTVRGQTFNSTPGTPMSAMTSKINSVEIIYVCINLCFI